jgi:hypothetical protein
MNWNNRFLTDPYGGYITVDAGVDDEGFPAYSRIENPDFNPELRYIPRRFRPEWCVVGLVGQIEVNKNAVKHERWIHMKDTTEDVAIYLLH